MIGQFLILIPGFVVLALLSARRDALRLQPVPVRPPPRVPRPADSDRVS